MRHAALLTCVALGLACKDDATTAPTSQPRVVGAVAKVVVVAARQTLSPGDSTLLSAQALDAQGFVLPTATITWSSSRPAVATVNARGMVTAVAQGSAQITATAEGQSGSLDIAVSVTELCDCTRIIDSTVTTLVQRNDSTGVYVFRIVASGAPAIDSGSIIVGAENGGFLRRVQRVARTGDVITLQTTQAYLEEAIREGEFAATSFSEGESVPIEAGAARWGPWSVAYLAPNVAMSTSQAGRCCSLNDLGFTLEIGGDVKGTGEFTIKDGEIVFEPRLQIAGSFERFQVQSFSTVLRGGIGLNINEYELKLGVEAGKDFTWHRIPKKKRRVARLVKPFLFFIGPVPVTGIVNKDISLEIEPSVAATAVFTGLFRTGFEVSAGAAWRRNSGWRPISGSSSYFEATAPEFQGVEGTAAVKIAIVPEYAILFYGVGGPFVNLEPYAEAEGTALLSFDAGTASGLDWETKISLGLNVNIGAKLSIFGVVDLVEAGFEIPIIRPYTLIRAFSDGPLAVHTVVDGPDQPDSIALRLRPRFEDKWELGFGNPPRVVSNGPPPFGRDLATSSQEIATAPNDTVSFLKVRSGDSFQHRIALHQLQSNCTARDSSHRDVAIRSTTFLRLPNRRATEASFAIDCIPLGALRVRSMTSGRDLLQRFDLQLTRMDTVGSGKGSPPLNLSIPGSVQAPDTVIASLTPANPANGTTGRYTAALQAARRNCAIARPASHQTVIVSGDTSLTEFLITCVALGRVTAETQTSDPDAAAPSDPVTFSASVTARDTADRGGNTTLSLGAFATATTSGLVPLYNASGASGRHDVRISSAPNRCRDVAPGARAVTVFPGDTAFAFFRLICVERLHVATRSTGPASDPDGYQVIVEQSDGSTMTRAIAISDTIGIAGVQPGMTTIRLAGVDPNCNAPAAVTRQVSGRDSTLVSFTVHCPGPPAPTGLRSTFVDSTRIDLAWDPPPPGRVIARYRLYRQTSGTPMTLLSDTLTGQAYRDSGLTPFTPYTYQVEALDAAGLVSPRSRPLTVRTLDGSPPSAATNLTATARSALRIDVTWTAAVDPETGIRRYRVYRDDVLVDSTSATSYADVGLAANTAYRYFVIAVNGQGLSGPPSNAGSAKTLDNTPPTAPSALSAVAVSTTQIDLAWLAASDPESGVVLYRIYRDGTVVGTTAALTYNDTGLTPRTTYTYVVTAVNGAGLEGPPSNSASATTHTPPIVTGDLVVSTQSVGSGIPPNGYQVQVTSLGVSVTQPVGPIGSTTFSQLAPQTYTVLLTSLPANCVVDDGANPRSVSVTAGGTATTTFRVRCQ